MRRSWVRIPSAPLEALRVVPAGFLVVVLAQLVGCSTEQEPPTRDEAIAPEVPVAPATPPGGISAAELRRQLGANDNAQFVRTGGKITQVELHESGVTDLTPLRGLPIQALGISGLPISDLTPLEGMPLEFLTAEETLVDDLSPLQGMPLKQLYLRGTKVRDITPLAKLPLSELNLVETQVADISTVSSMSLNTLWIASTSVTDLEPLRGKSLVSLDIEGTAVTDLSVLEGMRSLRRLNIAESQVKDLTPLRGLSLERLIFSPSKIERGIDAIRGMGSLQQIGVGFDTVMPSAEFWSQYDSGAFSATGAAEAEQ